MRDSEAAIIKTIKNNLRGRKIALRWKDESFERIMAEEGLSASVYISDAPGRIDNVHTFPSSFLNGKRNEYYQIVSPELPQSVHEKEKYCRYGYLDEREILWMSHLPFTPGQAEKYDNKFHSESDINVMFTGWGASVSIGKNVQFPKNKSLVVPSDSSVKIGDNVNFNVNTIMLDKGSELNIGKKLIWVEQK